MNTQNPSNIQDLPAEIILRIFDFLDPRSQARAGLGCKFFHEIAEEYKKRQNIFLEKLQNGNIDSALDYIRKYRFHTNCLVSIKKEDNVAIETSFLHLLSKHFINGKDNFKIKELFNLILSRGANINIKTKDQLPLLKQSIVSNNKDLFDFLIANGADVNLGIEMAKNCNDAYYLHRLLDNNVKIDSPAELFEELRSKCTEIRWSLLWLRLLKAYVSTLDKTHQAVLNCIQAIDDFANRLDIQSNEENYLFSPIQFKQETHAILGQVVDLLNELEDPVDHSDLPNDSSEDNNSDSDDASHQIKRQKTI